MLVHAPAHERPTADWNDRGLVRPVLDVWTLLREGEPVEGSLVVGTQPGEGRQVVAALEDVDRIELQQPQPLDDTVQLPGAGLWRAWPPEPLGRQGDPAGIR